jgi:integrase
VAKKYQGVRGPVGKQRDDGTYSFHIDYYRKRVGEPLTRGDRLRETVHCASKEEAARIRKRRARGAEPTAKQQKKKEATIPGFAKRYLELVLPTLMERSQEDRKVKVDSLKRYFGDAKLCGHSKSRAMEQITREDVQRFVNFRLGHRRERDGGKWVKGKSAARTVVGDVKTLKHMYAVAHAHRMISADAKERVVGFGRRLSGTKLPHVPRPGEVGDKARFLTKDEVDRLLGVCVQMGEQDAQMWGHVFPVVFTALRTGIRKKGLLGLKVKQVDLENRRIRDVVDKGPTSRRSVPVDEWLAVVLERLVEDAGDGEWLFGEKREDIRSAWKTALRRAEIEEPFTFHNLRDTCATWWVIGGGDVYRLRTVLGHRTVMMTEKYARMAEEWLDKVETLDRIVKKHSQKWARGDGLMLVAS